jgi:hypothetical protein
MRHSLFAALYSRLLRKLGELRLPLLSESTFGCDFIGITSERSSHIDFVDPGSLLPFEPLIIGTVRDLYDMVCTVNCFPTRDIYAVPRVKALLLSSCPFLATLHTAWTQCFGIRSRA